MERALIAYLLGSLLGSGALLVETIVTGSPLRLGTFAAYAVGGGVLAAVTRAMAEFWIPGYGARVACFAALSAFAVLHLAYFANVKVLPSEPYWTPLSLGADSVVAVFVLYLAWRGVRSERAQALRVRFARSARAAGLVSLALGVAGLSRGWPAGETTIPRPGGDGPNLLLLVMDSARRGSLGLYGHSRPTSPSLDGWAPRSRVFSDALAASSWTVPSVETLLQTDATPAPPLARRLAEQGYVTACFTDNPHLYRGSPLLAGFDHVERSVGAWRNLLRGTVLGETIERVDPGDDERLVERARRFAEAQRAPVFLYVHLMDSHTPYRHEPIDGRRRRGRHIDFPATGMIMTAEEAEDIVARYEGGIRRTDAAVGSMLGHAEGWGRPWLAIVTADHGESLGEDGRWFHGRTLAPELLEVPLLVMGTDVDPGRFRGVVGHSVVPETLALAAGLPASPRALDLRRSDGPGVADGGLPPALSYRVAGEYKFVLDETGAGPRLFNRRRDPGETEDLSGRETQLAAELASALRAKSTSDPGTVPPEQVERLKALGYSGTGAERPGSR